MKHKMLPEYSSYLGASLKVAWLARRILLIDFLANHVVWMFNGHAAVVIRSVQLQNWRAFLSWWVPLGQNNEWAKESLKLHYAYMLKLLFSQRLCSKAFCIILNEAGGRQPQRPLYVNKIIDESWRM